MQASVHISYWYEQYHFLNVGLYLQFNPFKKKKKIVYWCWKLCIWWNSKSLSSLACSSVHHTISSIRWHKRVRPCSIIILYIKNETTHEDHTPNEGDFNFFWSYSFITKHSSLNHILPHTHSKLSSNKNLIETKKVLNRLNEVIILKSNTGLNNCYQNK